MSHQWQKVLKTRKEHTCWGCGEKIPKGTKSRMVKNVDDDGWIVTYYCSECERKYNEIINNDKYAFSEGIAFGEIEQYYKDYFQD